MNDKPQKKYYIRKEAVENDDVIPYLITEDAYLELNEKDREEYISLVQLNG